MPRLPAAAPALAVAVALALPLAAACGEDNPEIGSAGGAKMSCDDPTEVQVPHGHDDGASSAEGALKSFLESNFAEGLPEEGYKVDFESDQRVEYLYEREGRRLIKVHLNREDGWVVEGFSGCGEFSRP